MLQNWKFFFGKLNQTTRDALESAVGLCASRTHYEVEVEHYLMKLLDETDSDLQRILKHFGVDQSRLATDLTRSLDRMKSGNGRGPVLSQMIVHMLTEAWLLGSVDYGAGQIRSAFTMMALYSNEDLTRIIRDVSKELQKIQPDALRQNLLSIAAGSHEDAITAAAEEPGAASAGGDRPRAAGRIIRSSRARRESARPRSLKVSPCASLMATCPRFYKTSRCELLTWRCCRPEPA